MAITAANLIARGMNPIQANALVTEFAGTVAAADLIPMGFSVPLANELARQKNDTALDAPRLMALGMPPALAQYIKDNG